jgi:hypothetical protein
VSVREASVTSATSTASTAIGARPSLT